jgi:hypothetical protein
MTGALAEIRPCTSLKQVWSVTTTANWPSVPRVRSQSKSNGIYGVGSGIGSALFRVHLFLLPIFIPQIVSHSSIFISPTLCIISSLAASGARGRAVGWDRMVVDSIPDEVIGFLNWPNPSSCTMALGSTQPLAEMSTRNLPGGKRRPARKADNLTGICEPIVEKLWEPRRLTTLRAFMACFRDRFAFTLLAASLNNQLKKNVLISRQWLV